MVGGRAGWTMGEYATRSNPALGPSDNFTQ